jgi:hypothetical protein
VSYDRGGVADGIIKFSHDKDVQTLIISSKGDRQLSRLRLTYSITDECLRNSTLDVMVWMDGQTRNISASRYIWNFDVPQPLGMGLSYNDNTKLPQANPSPCFADENDDDDENEEVNSKMKASKISSDNEGTKSSNEQKSKSEAKKSKNKSVPHQPDYPRPPADLYRPYEEPPIAPISESTIHAPISDLSATKKQRRKNSLKYSLYDSIARGKKSLGWDGVYLEPLSP